MASLIDTLPSEDLCERLARLFRGQSSCKHCGSKTLFKICAGCLKQSQSNAKQAHRTRVRVGRKHKC